MKTKLHNETLLLTILLFVSALTAILLFLPINGEEQIYGETFRVHILAASDKPDDQRIKYQLRDELMPIVYTLVTDCETLEETEAALVQNKATIEETASRILEKHGITEGVRVEIGQFRYDRRTLSGKIYPAGAYPSLRVVIGKGQGQNWWSVLYPSTALYISSDAPAQSLYGPNEPVLPENISFRFRSLEWLSSVFSSENIK